MFRSFFVSNGFSGVSAAAVVLPGAWVLVSLFAGGCAGVLVAFLL
jgi:hypothetical protein